MTIRDNLQIIGSKINEFIHKYHRQAGSVQLLAVSKKHPSSKIKEAYDAGQHAFGENYVQELVEKAKQLKDLDIEWHFIGPLQSNKTRIIANIADWVHTIDRLKIAKRLSEQRSAEQPPLSICIQVNISGESSKSGIMPGEAIELCEQITPLPNVQLRGLMAIPAPEHNLEKQRATFAKLAQLKKAINKQLNLQLDTLSMGMSDDMEAAVAEGATIVRIGTAIFGKREDI